MDFNSTEEQQLETLKRWWKEYGKSIIVGAVVGLGGLFSWKYYQDHQVTSRAVGADSFVTITTQLATQGPDAFNDVAAFVEQNKGNNYGELAALLLAGAAAKADQLPLAQQQLELALANTKDAVISDTIRLRLVRVLLAQDLSDEAQTQLNAVKQDAFSAERSEVQGDLYVAKGNNEEAYLAYQAAEEAGGLNNNPALKLKLDNLAQADKTSVSPATLPVDNTPAEQAPADDTPADKAPADKAATPSENAVATPAENAVAEPSESKVDTPAETTAESIVEAPAETTADTAKSDAA